jgi:hypothetical protein
MLDLKTALQQISQKWNYKLDEISPNVFRMDVALKLKDGSFRYQFVYIWRVAGQNGQRDRFYMNSRCGRYNMGLNLYNMMKEAGWCNYSALTITNDKDKDGNPCETIITQAAPYADNTSLELLNDIIFEVANNADIIEEKYFGGDNV